MLIVNSEQAGRLSNKYAKLLCKSWFGQKIESLRLGTWGYRALPRMAQMFNYQPQRHFVDSTELNYDGMGRYYFVLPTTLEAQISILPCKSGKKTERNEESLTL